MFDWDRRDTKSSEVREEEGPEDRGAVFRAAMVGHFRSHIAGTGINESTLITSDYLTHFQELVTLLEAVASRPTSTADDLLSWRPRTYEEHFSQSGFPDKTLAIAAYRGAPQPVRECFDDAVARLQAEALTLVAEVAGALGGTRQGLDKACEDAVARLRILIEEANAIANGQSQPIRKSRPALGDADGKARIGTRFGTR
jgi:hypothetical protein